MHPSDMDILITTKITQKKKKEDRDIIIYILLAPGVQTNYGKLLNFSSESFPKFCDARKSAKLKTS